MIPHGDDAAMNSMLSGNLHFAFRKDKMGGMWVSTFFYFLLYFSIGSRLGQGCGRN